MANNVFANNNEVSCKAASGMTTAALPDTCFTPPENPATPPGVPVPYPNTGKASDTTDGSKTVKISNKEVGLKDKSCFKTSYGDEAGCAAKKGIITSKNKGKVYFQSWSSDVKFEGKNAVRHLDMTTNNHASSLPGDTPPWVYIDTAAISDADDECKKQVQDKNDCMEKHTKESTTKAVRQKHRKPGVTIAKAREGPLDESLVDWPAIQKEEGFAPQAAVQRSFCEDKDCKDTLDCTLVPYDGFCCPAPDEEATPPVVSKTPHHVVPAHCFLEPGGRSEGEGKTYDHVKDYKHTKAPCICLEGQTKSDSEGGKLKEHGRVHEILDAAEQDRMPKTPRMGKTKQLTSKGELLWDREAGTWSFSDANEAGSDAVSQVTGCDKECLKQQSAAAHKSMDDNIDSEAPLRADPFGKAEPGFVPGSAAPPSPTTLPS
jgi:hypothetical protein